MASFLGAAILAAVISLASAQVDFSDMSPGEIAGIVVGAVVFLILIIIIIIWCFYCGCGCCGDSDSKAQDFMYQPKMMVAGPQMVSARPQMVSVVPQMVARQQTVAQPQMVQMVKAPNFTSSVVQAPAQYVQQPQYRQVQASQPMFIG